MTGVWCSSDDINLHGVAYHTFLLLIWHHCHQWFCVGMSSVCDVIRHEQLVVCSALICVRYKNQLAYVADLWFYRMCIVCIDFSGSHEIEACIRMDLDRYHLLWPSYILTKIAWCWSLPIILFAQYGASTSGSGFEIRLGCYWYLARWTG